MLAHPSPIIDARHLVPAWRIVRPLFAAWWHKMGGGVCCGNFVRPARRWCLEAYVDALEKALGYPLLREDKDGRRVT